MSGLTRSASRGRTELPLEWRLDAGEYVVALDVSSDGRWCAVGTGGGDLVVADARTGVEQWRVAAHLGGVLALGFSPDGGCLASCGQDGRARLFSPAGEQLCELVCGAPWVEHLAWAPSGTRLATSSGRCVRIWTATGQPCGEPSLLPPSPPSTVTALAWTGKGEQVAAASYGGVHLWTLPELSQGLAAPDGGASRHFAWKGSLLSMAWSPNGKLVACGSQENSVQFWRTASGEGSVMHGYAAKPKALAWDWQSSLLATGGGDRITLWDFGGKGPEGTRPQQLEGHMDLCTCMAWRPRSGILASGSADRGILLWEPRRATKPIRYALLEEEVTALAWHPEKTGLISADALGNVCRFGG